MAVSHQRIALISSLGVKAVWRDVVEAVYRAAYSSRGGLTRWKRP